MAHRAPRTLTIPRGLLPEIARYLRSVLPDEGCGLLVGSQGVVDRFVPVPNADPSPTTFLLDPVAHHGALLEAEAEGRELVGVVHSHPGSAAIPSGTDIAGALEPEWAYVIVGRLDGDPEVRAWWVIEGGVGEIPIVGDALGTGSP